MASEERADDLRVEYEYQHTSDGEERLSRALDLVLRLILADIRLSTAPLPEDQIQEGVP